MEGVTIMSRVEKAFLRAVEDLNAGHVESVERYLELVSRSEQEELADLLAMFFASRPPVVAKAASLDSPSYQRALAALDAVTENAGKTGVLPGTLVSLRRLRGMQSSEVTDELVRRFELGERARQRLERLYHRLEAGQLGGRQLSRRLLGALAEIFGAEEEDFLAASEPVASGASGRPAAVMARRAGRPAAAARPQPAAVPAERDAELEAVERLFTGGRDA
jgi:hypothetical protein